MDVKTGFYITKAPRKDPYFRSTCQGTQGLYILSLLSFTIEPLISWANANNTIVSEICLRLTCAAIYHNCGKDEGDYATADEAINALESEIGKQRSSQE